jgi:hypothetical protein
MLIEEALPSFFSVVIPFYHFITVPFLLRQKDTVRFYPTLVVIHIPHLKIYRIWF